MKIPLPQYKQAMTAIRDLSYLFHENLIQPNISSFPNFAPQKNFKL